MEINAKKRLWASEVEPDPDYEELFAEINLNEAIHGDLADLIKEHLLPGINAARAKYERAVADTEKKLKARALLHCQQARKLAEGDLRVIPPDPTDQEPNGIPAPDAR